MVTYVPFADSDAIKVEENGFFGCPI
jgi:hypothetical protein